MNKQSQAPDPKPRVASFSDANPVMSTALKSFAVGGSVAALSAMIADILETKRQRDEEKRRKQKGTSQDTVVFHLGRKTDGSEKAAQACEGSCECNPAECDGEKVVGEECRVVPKVEPTSEEREIAYQGQDSQPRTKDGKYSTLGKVAQQRNYTKFTDLVPSTDGSSANFTWNQLPGKSFELAAAPVAAVGGFFAVRALHKKLEENRLKRQIEAAQQEYVDLLDGKEVKTASAFSRIFLFDEERMVKQAQQTDPGYKPTSGLGKALGWAGKQYEHIQEPVEAANAAAKTFSAGTLAALLLTTSAGAWLTHKILASKFDKKEEEEEPNKVTKVMFKEFSDKSIEPAPFPKLMFKTASDEFEITPEQFLCTIEVLRGYIRGYDLEKTAQAVTDAEIADYRKLQAAADELNNSLLFRPIRYTANGGKPVTAEQIALAAMGENDALSAAIRQAGGKRLAAAAPKIKSVGIDSIRAMPYYLQGREHGMNDEMWQHALRSYANRETGLEYKPVAGMDARLAGAIGDRDPKAVEAALVQRMKDDPKGWFGLLGANSNEDVRNAFLAKHFSEQEGQGGFLGNLYKVPILGDLLKNMQSYFLNNTQWGRRMMARRAYMKATGATAEQANEFMKDYDFGYGKGWRYRPQQQQRPTEADTATAAPNAAPVQQQQSVATVPQNGQNGQPLSQNPPPAAVNVALND